MAKKKAGESKGSQARQTRGSKKQPATPTRKSAGNDQAKEEPAELQKPLTKPEQSGKRKVRTVRICVMWRHGPPPACLAHLIQAEPAEMHSRCACCLYQECTYGPCCSKQACCTTGAC